MAINCMASWSRINRSAQQATGTAVSISVPPQVLAEHLAVLACH
jgi:hypothetical protein